MSENKNKYMKSNLEAFMEGPVFYAIGLVIILTRMIVDSILVVSRRRSL